MLVTTHAAVGATIGAAVGKRYWVLGVVLAFLSHPILDRLDDTDSDDWVDYLVAFLGMIILLLILKGKPWNLWVAFVAGWILDLEHPLYLVGRYFGWWPPGWKLEWFIYHAPWPAWLKLPHDVLDLVNYGLMFGCLFYLWLSTQRGGNPEEMRKQEEGG